MRRLAYLGIMVLVAVLVAGCSPVATTVREAPTPLPVEPTMAAAEEPSPTAVVATDPATAVPDEETLSVPAADGLDIQATLYAPDSDGPSPGVMLLHMLGSNRASWARTGLIEELLSRDMAVLAVDMRGFGETGGEDDWTLAAEDLELVWQAFSARPEVDPAQTAIVGASIGANMALVTAASQPAVRAAVLLSPGLEYRGVTTDDKLADMGQRPLLIVASSEDIYAAESSETLATQAGDTAVLTMYDGAGHGTQMISREPELAAQIGEWLSDHLTAASP